MKQEHSGLGDNIFGDKITIINNGVDTSTLENFAVNFLNDISNGDIDIAQNKLNGILEIDTLNSDAKTLIDALKSRLDDKTIDIDTIKRKILILIRNKTISNRILDILSSLYLHIEYSFDTELAITWYHDVKDKGIFLNEVYYQFLASNQEIEIAFEKKHNLITNELVGLYHGSLRNDNFHLSLEIAAYLESHNKSILYKAYTLHSKILLLARNTRCTHIFSFSAEDKKNTEILTEQLIELLKINNSNQLTLSIINLLIITFFTDERIIDVAKKHIKTIQLINQPIAKIIEDRTTHPIIDSQFLTDHSIIDTELDMASLDVNIKSGKFNLSLLRDWRNSGGKVIIDNGYNDKFQEIRISAWLCNVNDREGIINLEREASDFLLTIGEYYKTIPPFPIIDLANIFLSLNLPILAINYLEPFIPDTPWISPLFETYLVSLYYGDQYSTCLDKINLISHEEKSATILFIESRIYTAKKNYDFAILYNKKAIKKDPNIPSMWLHLIELSALNKKKSLLDIIKNIPKHFFEKYNESTLPLLTSIAKHMGLKFVDSIMIDWFISNPNELARPITNIFFQTLKYHSELIKPFISSQFCVGAIVYDDDNSERQCKFLVKNISSTNQLFVDVTSKLGKALLKLSNGEFINDPMYSDFILVENIHPFVLVVRESANLRHTLNDGDDNFKIIKVSNDPARLIPKLEKSLERFAPHESLTDRMERIKKSGLPICTFTQLSHPYDLIIGIHAYLTSPNIDQCFSLYNYGEKNSKKFILDIYTIVYFSLNGIISILKDNSLSIVISSQTREAISDWLSDISHDDYLTISLTETGLTRLTSHDINFFLHDFISELKLLIEISNSEPLKIKNIPYDIVLLQKNLDKTIYSTLQLSICNDIPLLSIDNFLCDYLDTFNFPIVNALDFIHKNLP